MGPVTHIFSFVGAVSSRSVISSGNNSSYFWPKLFQGQDWSRLTHFLVLAWASSFEGLVQAPILLFLVLGLFSARCTARPNLSVLWAWVCLVRLSQAHLSFGFGPGLLQGQGWPRNTHFLGLSQACFIRRICWGLLSLTFWALASSGLGLALGPLIFLVWPGLFHLRV